MDFTFPRKQSVLFQKDNISVLNAMARAQFIAFAPYVFQASVALRDRGILRFIEEAHEGRNISEVAHHCGLSVYATRVLLEAGLGIGLLYIHDDRFKLAKTGHIFLNHKLAGINTDFVRDICLPGVPYLQASLEQGKPVGLQQFGNWTTIYEALAHLPQQARNSWFAFDHYYSDNAFPDALPLVFEQHPAKILDIGANTGKWALACFQCDHNVVVGLADLPGQLAIAKENVETSGFAHRAVFHPLNTLEPDFTVPPGYDTIWLSQFLDCFSESQIANILRKCYEALPAEGTVFANEIFWDRQHSEIAAFSLQMTSLYFTTMANGNSQIYNSTVFTEIVKSTGFEIRSIRDIGVAHTLFELKKP
jgi:precorrin-6B methylase 2